MVREVGASRGPLVEWGSKTQRRSLWRLARYVRTKQLVRGRRAPQTPPLGQHHRQQPQQYCSTPRVAEHT